MSALRDLVRDHSGIGELADIGGGNPEVAGDLPDAHSSEWRIFGQIYTVKGYLEPSQCRLYTQIYTRRWKWRSIFAL